FIDGIGQPTSQSACSITNKRGYVRGTRHGTGIGSIVSLDLQGIESDQQCSSLNLVIAAGVSFIVFVGEAVEECVFCALLQVYLRVLHQLFSHIQATSVSSVAQLSSSAE